MSTITVNTRRFLPMVDQETDRPQLYGDVARVGKVTARRLFEAGVPLIIVGHKMVPDPSLPNSTAMTLDPSPRDGDADVSLAERFERYVNSYRFHNCVSETGYYPAFYVKCGSVRQSDSGQWLASVATG